MPSALRALARALAPPDPAWGVDKLRTLRFAGVLTAVFTPIFGGVYWVAVPEASDPVLGRALVVACALGLVGLSYADTYVRREPGRVLALALFGLLGWSGALTYMNDLDPAYALGYLFVTVAVAMVYSVICDSVRPMAWMLLVAGAFGLAIAWGVDEPGLVPAAFAVCVVPGGIIIYFAFSARLLAVRALTASQSELADAEGLAQTGSWFLDLRTRHRTWSEGAYRILGMDRSLPPVAMTEFVHPDDLDQLAADKERMYRELDVSDQRYRIVRPDGEVRVIRTVVRVIRDDEGVAIQLRGVFLDITEQTVYEENLRAARDQAEAAALAKTAFLANMSHEIRTPLTAIIGFAQILRDEVGGAHADLIEPIEAGGQRLLETLNSVLDIARMEAGETDLDLVPTRLVGEVQDVADLLRGQAARKGLALSVDLPADEVVVRADPAALARVVTNLLANAIKFTDAGGVSVAVRREGDRVEVEVADTGRGIAPAVLDRIFEPFQQVSTGWARTHEGTGLGLTITRRLVEAMGGTIRVDSTVGLGSQFVVSFPSDPGAAEEAVSVPERLAA